MNNTPSEHHITKTIQKVTTADDAYRVFLYAKAERLITATYVVTNLFPAQEPLKWEIRTYAVRLLSKLQTLLVDAHVSAREIADRMVVEISMILSLFDIAHTGHILSDMNYTLLHHEYSSLIQALQKEEIVVSKDMYSRMLEDLFTQELPVQQTTTVKDTSAQHNNTTKAPTEPVQKPHVHKVRSQPLKDITKDIEKKATDASQNAASPKGSRKQQILRLIEAKGAVTLSDITHVITDCSGKTIQRDLHALVRKGILKKEGERRWSTYSLVR